MPGNFGSLGQIVISTDLPLGVTSPALSVVHSSLSMGGGSSTTFGIQPSADYFFAPNMSLGGLVGIVKTSFGSGGGDITAISIGARFGYNLALSPTVSLWLRGGLTYTHSSVSSGGMDFSGYFIPLTIFAPVLWHPAQHFFVGLGPVFVTDLIAKTEGNDAQKETDFGVQAVIGGYFGGI